MWLACERQLSSYCLLVSLPTVYQVSTFTRCPTGPLAQARVNLPDAEHQVRLWLFPGFQPAAVAQRCECRGLSGCDAQQLPCQLPTELLPRPTYTHA